ncbi:MAG: hypothetical protein F4187_04235 [Gemmatimonadetes bacterium]|nr:hypothetical protein [Gemmatimonadota bacterium]MYI06195.1 hypothetical protein [Gemmatimonadota bacterium]
MVWTTECVVDILRRTGPGALPADRLKAELRLARPPIFLTRGRLDQLVGESEGRIALLEVKIDDAERTALESWVVLTDPGDRPTGLALAGELWRSLSALAAELNPASRVEVSRWILQASLAERTCSAALGSRPAYYRPARYR